MEIERQQIESMFSNNVLKDAFSAMHDIPVIKQKLVYILDRLRGGTTVNVLDDNIYNEDISAFIDEIVRIINGSGVRSIPKQCVSCPYESLGMCYFDKDRVMNCIKIKCPKTKTICI